MYLRRDGPWAAVIGRTAAQALQRGFDAYLAGNLVVALEAFRFSVSLNPFNPAAQSNLGYALADAGRVDEALHHQNQALTIEPRFANAHYGAAQVHKRRGNWAMARAHWLEYLRLEPGGGFAATARAELDTMPP